MLAVAHPWASASSYLSSQSLADSRCNLHAASYATRSQYGLRPSSQQCGGRGRDRSISMDFFFGDAIQGQGWITSSGGRKKTRGGGIICERWEMKENSQRQKERKQKRRGRDGRTARRHHTGILRRGV